MAEACIHVINGNKLTKYLRDVLLFLELQNLSDRLCEEKEVTFDIKYSDIVTRGTENSFASKRNYIIFVLPRKTKFPE